MTGLIRPPALRPGDRVRIIAPSGPVDPARFASGVEILQRWDLDLAYSAGADGVLARDGYFAGSDERRLEEFLAALDDSSARAIWLARGGYGAARLLPELDVELVAARPRWLIGFSDASALHAAWARAGIQSLHAAVVSNLVDWSAVARDQLRHWLFAEPGGTLRGRAVEGRAEFVKGPLLGGNITVLASLCGTGKLPNFDGAIVFLEDVSEAPYRLDRALTQLVQSGAFDAVAAFAIGQLSRCDGRGDYNCSALEAVCRALQPVSKPILHGLPVGHDPESFPLPFGAMVTLDGVGATLRFDEPSRTVSVS